MAVLTPFVLCLTLAALTAGRPNNVHTQVEASQSGWTRGGASQVSQVSGAASAQSQRDQKGWLSSRNDRNLANAAVELQGQYGAGR